MKFLHSFKYVAVIVVAIFIIFAVMSDQGEEGSTVGKTAYDFTLFDLEGNEVRLSDFRGKVVYINYWATWCVHCKTEMPAMEVLYRELGDDLVILAVNVQERRAVVDNFLVDKDYTYPILLDEKGEVMELYNVRGIPTNIFVDGEGRICSRYNGAISLEMMKQAVNEADDGC